jgi:phage-related protein
MCYTSGENMTWTVDLYRDAKGNVPVEDFLVSLPEKDRARIAWTINLLEEYSLQLSSPYVKHLRGKLWELRIRAGRSVYRIIYFAYVGQRFILLCGFLKKTQKTPRRELEIAERRMSSFLTEEKTE